MWATKSRENDKHTMTNRADKSWDWVKDAESKKYQGIKDGTSEVDSHHYTLVSLLLCSNMTKVPGSFKFKQGF